MDARYIRRAIVDLVGGGRGAAGRRASGSLHVRLDDGGGVIGTEES